MTRGRTTPYTAQLKRYLEALDAESAAPFSAATLEKEFTHPRKPKLATRIAGIHKALVRSFAAGEVITFADESGAVMREPERLVPGSKAVAQPQIFALPGTPSPDPAFHPMTQEASTNGHVESAEPKAAGPAGPITADEAERRIAAYVDSPPATAPGSIPASALRAWVSLPPAATHWRRRLDQAPPTERIQLIQAGVARRSDIGPASYAARGIAALCRRRGPFWPDLVPLIAEHYAQSGLTAGATLAAFAEDPTAFYLDNEHDPFALLFVGTLMGLLEDQLRDLAQACEDAVHSEPVRLDSDRVAELEAEVAEARKALKQLGRELKAGERERDDLEKQLEVARTAQSEEARQGALGKERARRERVEAELATAQRELKDLRPAKARVKQLDGEVARLEKALAGSRASAESERVRRLEADSRAEAQERDAEALRERVSAAEDAAAMPVDDPLALLRALAGPVGEAVGRSGARLASGTSSSDDERLIRIATALMEALRDVAAR